MNYQDKKSACTSCGALQERLGEQCQNCGGSLAPQSRPVRSKEELSSTVKVYTGIFVAWALIFPFLIPIILKLSQS